MKTILATAFVVGLATAAYAQTPSSKNESTMPAAPDTTLTAPQTTTPTTAPEAGANSFTEGQARARLDRDGYASITGLAKDKDGVWRGKAMHGGNPVDVGVDYKGNIVAR